MMALAGTEYDPILIRTLIKAVGLYPIGTLVRLASGRLALVVGAPSDPDRCHRPIVQCIGPEEGSSPPARIDLSERTPGGEPTDRIVESLDPEEAGVDPQSILG